MGARGGDDHWLPRRLRADPARHRLGTAAPVADRRIDVRSKTALAEVLAVEILEHALPFGGRPFGRQAGDPVQELPSDRSEERRVGKECVSTCKSRWSPYH